MNALEDKIAAVEAALEKQPPFCTGLLEIDEASSKLFYKKGGNSAGFLSLASADTDALQDLTDTCLPAKFGRGTENVFDESYRKAKKMDTSEFMTSFDPVPILRKVRAELLDGENQNADIRYELYQLNVYEKGSFFKAHRDTPRSPYMFASLVVVFPSPHEGRQLILRHGGEEWTFDSAEMVSKATTPSAAFVSLYSDVEHEVTPVESGHRVTLTYNIYRNRRDANSSSPTIPSIQSTRSLDSSSLKATIADLLQDPTCLPKGGYFGFGLRFLYPAFGGANFSLHRMLKQLKGSDEVINKVCTSLFLKTSLHILVGDNALLDDTEDLGSYGEVDFVLQALSERVGVVLVRDWKRYSWDTEEEVDGEYDSDEDSGPHGSTRPIMWLSKATDYVQYSSEYAAYGNEASVGHVYGEVCLVAKVGSVNNRETK